VSGEVFGFFAYHLSEPAFYARVIYIVVIHPALVACVVGRVDVDTFYSSLVFRQQGFEGFEVVAVNDFVAAPHPLPLSIVRRGVGKRIFVFQHSVRNIYVVVYDLAFSEPV
jgi:hypothetical protein